MSPQTFNLVKYVWIKLVYMRVFRIWIKLYCGSIPCY